jgi:hypothetical protein
MHNNNTPNNTQAFISLKYNNLYIVGDESKVSKFHTANKDLLRELSQSSDTVTINVDEIENSNFSNIISHKEYNTSIGINNNTSILPESADITIRLDQKELNMLKRVRLYKSFSTIHETLTELLKEADREFLDSLIQRLSDETKESEQSSKHILVESPNIESEDCCSKNPKDTYYCAKEHFYKVKEIFLKSLFYIFEGGRAYSAMGLVEVLVKYTEIDLSDTKFWVRRLAKVLGELRKKGVLKRQKSGKTMYWYLAKTSLKKLNVYPLSEVNHMKKMVRTSNTLTADERGSGRIVSQSDERGSGRVSPKKLVVVK